MGKHFHFSLLSLYFIQRDAESSAFASMSIVASYHSLAVQAPLSTTTRQRAFLNDQNVLNEPRHGGGTRRPREGKRRHGTDQGQRDGQRHELFGYHRRRQAPHGGPTPPQRAHHHHLGSPFHAHAPQPLQLQGSP